MTEQIDAHGDDSEPLPTFCPTGAPDAPNRAGRDAHGRFLPGNLAAVSHALRATTLPAELQHLPAEIDAWMANAVADEGDPDDVPTRRRSLIEYRGRLHRRIVQLDTALELRGLLDRRGKLRVAWLQQLSSLITAAKALDTLLGLERRAKDLTRMSAEQWAASHARAE